MVVDVGKEHSGFGGLAFGLYEEKYFFLSVVCDVLENEWCRWLVM